MGARYCLKLYFPVERSEDVLIHLVDMASQPDPRNKTIVLSDSRKYVVPFTSRFDSGQTLTTRHRDPSIEVDLSLLFPADEAILTYIDSQHAVPLGGPAPLGFFYLTVRLGDEYSCFEFRAATKAMGHLFVESPSVEKQFLELLKQCGGLVGVIDLSDDNYSEHPVLGIPGQKVRPQYLPYVDEEVKLLLSQLD